MGGYKLFIKLNESNNILEDIFTEENTRNRSTLLNINEHFGDPGTEVKNVYFYRYIGFENKQDYLNKIQVFRSKLKEKAIRYVEFKGKIDQPYNMKLADKVNEVLSKISELDFRNERGRQRLAEGGLFNLFGDTNINTLIRNAYKTVMEIYYVNEPKISLSIEKNFIIKLFLWMGEYIPRLLDNKTLSKGAKVVYYGDIKKHEVYFMIMLSQLGCDALIISSEGDGDYGKVDKTNSFSKLLTFPKNEKMHYDFTAVQQIQNAQKSSGKAMEYLSAADLRTNSTLLNLKGNGSSDNPTIIKKEAINIFEDICFPLSKRIGYVSLPSPVLPVFFYRYIGFNGEGLTSEDEYYNSVFYLDKKLANLGTGYVRFVNNIPAPMNDEVDSVSKILGQIKDFQPNNIKRIINDLVNIGIIYNLRDPLWNKYLRLALDIVLELYLKNETSVNAARLQNFVYKLVVWVNRYYKILFVNKNFQESPKILYYGDIKPHEIYLLIFLNNIGCDVLYLTTEEQKDKHFLEIDKDEAYTTLQVNEKTAPMQDFPVVEKAIRKTTTAFNASRQLENIIYSGDVGLYKPWQLEDYDLRQVTLRTTYDELKILWKEDSKIRPEFKTDNGIVYIPNLFAKISGTKEIIEEYWQDYRALSKHQNTVEFTKVPFTKNNFSRQDIYSIAFMMDKNGNINKEALMTSNYYKFSYLRTSLQRILVEKIDELMKTDNFKRSIDNNFRLLILMVILNIDEKLLKLIETFDYPGVIPKVVIYNNTKDSFSDEDAIILAFLNSMGFDIAIFTPTNYNTIEQKLKEDMFDKFQLPSIQYDLMIPNGINNDNSKGKSIFSRMFGL